jgi:HD-GYP domain-containing protein (c-di-GMP phosphodiesterase class II)
LEILEKPGKLTDDEWPVMRSHVYYTYRALESIEAFSRITPWSALHQERLNGMGYPFGYAGEEIPLGARVMAVADVFTGITENRPYRVGMAPAEARKVLLKMAAQSELDGDIVNTLLDRFDEFERIRRKAQEKAVKEYSEFRLAVS